MDGNIFAIKQFSLHDGPHLRTTVFFKGCPMNCLWCHNPEGISPQVQIVSDPEKCVGCGECADQCETGSLKLTESGPLRNNSTCRCCGSCTELCPSLAHEKVGWRAGVAEVLSEIEKDIPFYDCSGGGVTFSGGEPLAQPEFLLALLKGCEALAIHRTVDTSLHAPENVVAAVAEKTDLFLCDIKHMDSSVHQRITGVDNVRILGNIRFLASEGYPLRIRLPLIPSVNDDEGNLIETIAFIKSLGSIESVDLLPYHKSGRAKYKKLDMINPLPDTTDMDRKALQEIVDLFHRSEFKTVVGG